MKKLSRPVKGDAWEHIEGEWRACTDAVFKADTFPCYIVPAALWRKAQAALKKAKGGGTKS